MKTYIYTETDSPERGMDVRISVWRIKNNQPRGIGHSDSQTASWRGAKQCASSMIVRASRGPAATVDQTVMGCATYWAMPICTRIKDTRETLCGCLESNA